MGKKVRINGYDTNALTRQETITDKKKVTGYNSQTFQKGNETKQKINITSDENTDTLEQIEDMLSNPKFQTTKVMGLQENEKVIIHNNNFKHGKGPLNHITADAVEVKEFGVKSDVHNIAKEDKWQIVVEEDFNANNFPSNIAVNNNQTSSGLSNQERVITYKNTSQTATLQKSSASNYGGSSLKINNQGILQLSNTAMYNNFDVEFIWKHNRDNPSDDIGRFNFMFGRVGDLYTNGKQILIEFDLGLNRLELYNSYDDPHTSSPIIQSGINLLENVWYTTRIVKQDKKIIIYLNGVKIADYILPYNVFGNLGFFVSTTGAYLDKLVVKTIPHEMLSFPENSKVVGENLSYETPFGKGQKLFGKNIDEFKHGVSEDSQLHLDFRDNKGFKLKDKSDNNHDVNVTNGEWVDGYFYKGIKVSDGDIQVKNDASISDLSELSLHTRFKLQNLETISRSLQANPIISKGNEFTVYDYKRPNRLIRHYKLNNNLVDDSGFEEDGIANGTLTYEIGKLKQSIDFGNSTSNYIDSGIEFENEFSGEVVTISAWIYANVAPTSYINLLSGSGTNNFRFFNTGEIGFTAGGIKDYKTSYDVPAQTWFHAVWEYSDVAGDVYLKMYINGELISYITHSTQMNNTFTSNLRIGTLDGNLDDVRIFKGKLDENEIKQLYNEGLGTEKDLNLHRLAFEVYGELLIGDTIEEDEWIEAWFLCDGKSSFIYRREGQEIIPEARKVLGELKAWFTFDDDLSDQSVNAIGTLTNSGAARESQTSVDRFSTYIYFNPSSDYLTQPSSEFANKIPTTNLSFTASCWVRMASTADAMFISKWFGEPNGIGLGYLNNSFFASVTNDADTSLNLSANFQADTSRWHHVLMTWDNSSLELKIYVNGMLQASDTHTGTFTSSTGKNVYDLGRRPNNTYLYLGRMDEVRHYSRVLTYEEIQFLYTKGTYTQDLTVNSKGLLSRQRESGLLTHYKFDGNEIDSSIHGRDYTFQTYNQNGTFVEGKINRAIRFSQSGSLLQYFQVNEARPFLHRIDGTTSTTFAFWIKPDGTDMVGNVFSKPYNGSGQYNYKVYQTENATYFDIFNTSTNSTVNIATTARFLTADVWQHVFVYYDQGRFKVYVDNELFTEATYDISAYTTPSQGDIRRPLAIGTLYPYGGSTSISGKETHAFSADWEDFRIYNYALDANERAAIYNNGNGTESDSYNVLTVDLIDLQDNFYVPHRHLDGLSQVRIWDLDYDKIDNPYMKSLVNYAPLERVGNREDYIKNVYDEAAYVQRGNGSSENNFVTDTWSKFVPAAMAVDYATNGYNDGYSWYKKGNVNLSMGDINNAGVIYEQTISFWYRSEQTGTKYILSTKIDADTSGWYLIQSGFVWEGSTGTGVTHDINFNTDFVDNVWRKFDIVFSHGKTSFYVNGELYSYEDNSAVYGTYIVANTGQRIRVDGYNTGFDIGQVKMYDRALTAQEIKESFIYEPLNPYYRNNQMFSKYYEQDDNNAVFIENGLFGMVIYKALPAEAKRLNGGVDFYRWDNGWKSVGKLMTEKSD